MSSGESVDSAVVDDSDEVVVERGANHVGVGNGVVALASEDGDELRTGFVEATAFADGLESAVELEGPGAVAVAEKPSMRCDGVALAGRWLHRQGVGFDGSGGVEVLVGDDGVGDAGVDEGHAG